MFGMIRAIPLPELSGARMGRKRRGAQKGESVKDPRQPIGAKREFGFIRQKELREDEGCERWQPCAAARRIPPYNVNRHSRRRSRHGRAAYTWQSRANRRDKPMTTTDLALDDALFAGPAPPAPVPPPHDLPWWRAVARLNRNPLTSWPARCYEEPISVRHILGRTMVLVNDPQLIPQVLGDTDGATARPVASKRMLRPGTGNGVLLAEGGDWRRQRRILAPAFTP